MLSAMKSKFNKVAFYPGSFNPGTFGHLHVIELSALFSDKVYVGVGFNTSKKDVLFTAEERVEMLQDDINEIIIPNLQAMDNDCEIEVIQYSNATARQMQELGASVLVRGIRDGMDLAEEERLRLTNAKLFGEGFAQVYVPPTKLELLSVSSSVARELCLIREDDELSNCVTERTKTKLIARMEERGIRQPAP